MTKQSGRSGNGPPSGAHRWLQEKPVGEGLRDIYRNVLDEPIPERLRALIEELRKKEER